MFFTLKIPVAITSMFLNTLKRIVPFLTFPERQIIVQVNYAQGMFMYFLYSLDKSPGVKYLGQLAIVIIM